MAVQHRRINAATDAHARGAADNLVNQGFVIELQSPTTWTLRKARRRGDIVATISIAAAPPPAATVGTPLDPWGPPTGPPAG